MHAFWVLGIEFRRMRISAWAQRACHCGIVIVCHCGMHAVQEQIAFAEEHGLFRAASALTVTSSLLRRGARNLYRGLPTVSRCDVFISHSWSCPNWVKFLAICHYLNLDLAIVLSVLACLFAMALLVLHAGNWHGVALLPQGLLYGGLVCWPIAVFILAYLFGHVGGQPVISSSFLFRWISGCS